MSYPADLSADYVARFKRVNEFRFTHLVSLGFGSLVGIWDLVIVIFPQCLSV